MHARSLQSSRLLVIDLWIHFLPTYCPFVTAQIESSPGKVDSRL
jgi:hypothetical protein